MPFNTPGTPMFVPVNLGLDAFSANSKKQLTTLFINYIPGKTALSLVF
jgi:hypothetical protein